MECHSGGERLRVKVMAAVLASVCRFAAGVYLLVALVLLQENFQSAAESASQEARKLLLMLCVVQLVASRD